MILERLIELRDRMLKDPESTLMPVYHKRQRVKWILEISANGTFGGFTMSGQTKKEIKEFDTPYSIRTSNPYPFLLSDKPEYVLGKGRKQSNGTDRHDLYCQLVRECAEQVKDSGLSAFVSFLDNEEELQKVRVEARSREIASGEILLPRVDGTILTADPHVQQFWQERQDREAKEKNTRKGLCMVCGTLKPIAKTHPIELLVGADRAAMAAGNEDAFLSYGFEQSEIAPMCQSCACSYGQALSWLLWSDEHRFRTGDVTWVFWTKYESDFNPMQFLSDPHPEDVKRLLQGAFLGSRPVIDDNAFYALALSSNKGRLIVRNWLTVSLAEAKENLRRYFDRQQIAGRDGAGSPLKLMALAGATVRELKDPAPQVVPALLDHALTGTPLPLWLLQQAVARARAERGNVMTWSRAALIKMVLLSHSYSLEDLMPTLNPDHPHPAYHCGRLLAVLDDVQHKAVSARATLIDRYYGAASTTPAVVFGVLMRNAQNHLSKLRKTRRGRYIHFERLITEILSHLDSFPSTLSLRDQGLFALGYYQQKNRPHAAEVTEDVAENEEAVVAE